MLLLRWMVWKVPWSTHCPRAHTYFHTWRVFSRRRRSSQCGTGSSPMRSIQVWTKFIAVVSRFGRTRRSTERMSTSVSRTARLNWYLHSKIPTLKVGYYSGLPNPLVAEKSVNYLHIARVMADRNHGSWQWSWACQVFDKNCSRCRSRRLRRKRSSPERVTKWTCLVRISPIQVEHNSAFVSRDICWFFCLLMTWSELALIKTRTPWTAQRVKLLDWRPAALGWFQFAWYRAM